MPADVLIVDDSTPIRKILQRMLKNAQPLIGKVFEAGDGLEALKVLSANNVALVLTDIAMPNMDGLHLLTVLRGNDSWKDLPVIMIVSEGCQQQVTQAAKLGASGCLHKPFTTDQITEKIGRFVLAGLLDEGPGPAQAHSHTHTPALVA